MEQIPQVYFISGVCGTGKSSVLKHLKNILPADQYDVRDFDERGVPDGGGSEWHDNETLYWLNVATENAKQNKSTIICGFAEPKKIKKIHKTEAHPPAKLFLLHASGDIIRQRLLKRHATSESIKEINRASGVTLEKFIKNNISYAPELRAIFEDEGTPIIETDTKTPKEVAKEIKKYILNSH